MVNKGFAYPHYTSRKGNNMGYFDILMMILSLLTGDNAPHKMTDDPRVLMHLQEVAMEISKAPSRYHADLISMGYNESRFGYRFVYEGKQIESNGDCGVFQQRPRFANAGRTSCKKLQSSKEAVKQAIAYIRYIEKRWGSHYITVKSKGRKVRQNIVICHYNGGNSCDTNRDKRVNSKDRAVRYAFNHNAIKKLVELKWLFDEVATN